LLQVGGSSRWVSSLSASRSMRVCFRKSSSRRARARARSVSLSRESALRRMGFAKEEVTGHGFRATARTILAERLDVAAELVEAQLAHAVSDSLGRAYNRARFLEQRRQMMTTWANYLDKLRTGFQAAPIAPPALVRMFTHAEELARNKDEPESK